MTGTEPILLELLQLARFVNRKNKELPKPLKVEIDPNLAIMMVNAIANQHKQAIADVVALLKGKSGMKYAFSRYEETKCSKNDAHLTRFDWADFIEKEMR